MKRALKFLGRWCINALIGLDQFANALLGPVFNLAYRGSFYGPYGDPDETISSATGKVKAEHGGEIPWSHPIARLLDEFLDLIDRNHSIEAIETDEGEFALYKKHK